MDADSLEILLTFALAHGGVNTILDVLQILLGQLHSCYITPLLFNYYNVCVVMQPLSQLFNVTHGNIERRGIRLLGHKAIQ